MLYLLLLLLFKIIYKMWFRNMSSVHCTIWKYRICWNPLTSTWIECRVSVVELQSSPSLVVERAEELKCKIIFGGKWLVSRRASQNYLRHGCFLSSRNQPHYSRDGLKNPFRPPWEDVREIDRVNDLTVLSDDGEKVLVGGIGENGRRNYGKI